MLHNRISIAWSTDIKFDTEHQFYPQRNLKLQFTDSTKPIWQSFEMNFPLLEGVNVPLPDQPRPWPNHSKRIQNETHKSILIFYQVTSANFYLVIQEIFCCLPSQTCYKCALSTICLANNNLDQSKQQMLTVISVDASVQFAALC